MAEESLKSSAGAEDVNPRVVKASSLDAKRKSTEDEKLIKKLFDLDPLDWARYPDGHLVFIASTGAKFSYTANDLEALTASAAKSSKTSAGAEVGDTRAFTASSLNAKSKSPKSKPESQPQPDPSQPSTRAEGEDTRASMASSLDAKSAQPDPGPTPAGARSQLSAGAESADPQPVEASSRQPAEGHADLYPQATE
jgi:hypothetical protein